MSSGRGGSGSAIDRIVADFETTTDPEDCRVWAWGLADIFVDNSFVHGNSIESFIEYISKFNSHIYFHNLAFDGSFILDWLLNNKYWHTDKAFRKGSFSTLISRMGKFYSISVVWRNGNKTEFRDSFKKLPMSVANVAKAFKLEESKLEIDYDEYRAPGHRLTPHEVAYLKNDVIIVAKALKQQLAEGMTHLTVGSDSLAQFKKISGKRTFDRLFPVLPQTMDAEIRKSYRGGFTYADERHKAKIVGTGRVYDVNSLYPSVMYDRMMPYGEPKYFQGMPKPTDEWPLYIVAITFTASLKEGHIPCIQVKGSPFFTATQYQSEIPDPVTMVCTNVDLALWEDQYDLDILAWEGGFYFKGITGIFCEYIDKWMKVKAEATGGLRTIAKLHLNSLYGKFATNPNVTPKVPVLNDEGVLHLVVGEEEYRDPVYTPVGVFITAYARDVTIRAAQENYDSFLYADTDSLHLLGTVDPSTLKVDPQQLGAWKYEGMFDNAIYARAKCYCEHMIEDGNGNPMNQFVTHIAGLPDSIAEQVTFDDFYNGKVFEGKLLPTRVKGGIVLSATGFTLNM
jgi:hypothetical protein